MSLLSHKKKRSSWKRAAVVILLAALAVAGFFLQRELRLPAPARLEVTSDLPGVGRRTTIKVRAHEPLLGVERVIVTGTGAGYKQTVLAEVAPAVVGAPPHPAVTLELPLGREATPDLKPGTLTLEVVARARGTRLRQPEPVVVKKTLEVKLEPPALAAVSQFIHPAQGGAEAVVYEVGPGAKRHGVQVGNWFFPGFPLPNGPPNQRFALFAAPYDLEVAEQDAVAQILLIAEDELGNRSQTQFIHKYIRRPLRKDVIELTEAFMKKVTSEIYPRTPDLTRKGNLLEDYLQLNRELRQKNMAELVALAGKSQRRFLWNETFLPMPNAAVKGSFADRRSYLADGKQVDTQDHLGFDLASLKGAPVPAANTGRVVLARYFGVFGNCVVVDHGFGLMSLSAHLSTMAVKEGDAVTRGQELGRTGATGLAGGDHLHFTMVLHGLPIIPTEWWDGHWIQDRLALKLGPSLPWKPAATGAAAPAAPASGGRGPAPARRR